MDGMSNNAAKIPAVCACVCGKKLPSIPSLLPLLLYHLPVFNFIDAVADEQSAKSTQVSSD